jgi:hypothetical protein
MRRSDCKPRKRTRWLAAFTGGGNRPDVVIPSTPRNSSCTGCQYKEGFLGVLGMTRPFGFGLRRGNCGSLLQRRGFCRQSGEKSAHLTLPILSQPSGTGFNQRCHQTGCRLSQTFQSSGANASRTLPGTPPLRGYPELTKIMPPTTTGPAPSSEPPLA